MNNPDNANSFEHSSVKVYLKKILIPSIIIAISLVIYYLMSVLAPKPDKVEVEQKAPLVKVLAIKQENINIPIHSQGNVSAVSESTLTAQVSGSISKVSNKFASGGYFAKGDMLLTIDNTDYQVALLEANARLTVAKSNLLEEQARVKQAQDEWKLSGKALSLAPVLAVRIPQLQKAEAEVILAEAVVQSAQTQLSRTTITAPYNAIISSTQVDVGQYVNTGSALATIFSVEIAKIRLPIKQQDIPFITVPSLHEQVMKADKLNELNSSKVKLFSSLNRDNNQDNAINTHLIGSEGVIDRTSRVQYVVAVIEDPYNLNNTKDKKALPIGSFLQAKIQGKTLNNVTKIPRSSVIGKNTVYLFSKDNTLITQSFNILRTDKQFIYTQDTFPSNAKLITTELSLPIEGMLLRVRSDNALNTATNTFSVSQSN